MPKFQRPKPAGHRRAAFAAVVALSSATGCQKADKSDGASGNALAVSGNNVPTSSADASSPFPVALAVTHGTAVGEVTSDSAIVWARANRASSMHVRFEAADADAMQPRPVAVRADRDFTGRVTATGLSPDRDYTYWVWFTETTASPAPKPGYATRGKFRTAPAPSAAEPVSFAWSGDLGGQNFCRDKDDGYAIFKPLVSRPMHFFIGLGDMIYADGECQPVGLYGNFQRPDRVGPSAKASDFWAHYRYNRDDDGFRSLLSKVGYYAVLDDHEAMNDVSPQGDTRPDNPDTHLLPLAVSAMTDYYPVSSENIGDVPKLYRSARWGKHLELFFLDTRQFRDANDKPDTKTENKTLLGSRQRQWLVEAMSSSDATWKVVVSSVPIAVPTGPVGGPRDGWASATEPKTDRETGYERELRDIFSSLQAAGVKTSVWITTDVHFATGIKLQPIATDPTFVVYEFIAGPMSAGFYPKDDLDETFKPERLFKYAPDTAESVEGYADAKRWLNFAVIDIDAAGSLSISYVNALGETVYENKLSQDP